MLNLTFKSVGDGFKSMLGDRLAVDLPGVVLLRDYPNSVYFNAFDAIPCI